MQRLFITLLLTINNLLGLFAQEFSIKEFKVFNYEDYVMEAQFSPYGNYFAVTVGNNKVFLYDKNFKKIWEHQGEPRSVGGHLAFSPDEKYLAIAKFKSKVDIGILNLETLTINQELSEHTGYINAIEFTSDGRFLASGSSDNTVVIWKWNKDKYIKSQVLDAHVKTVEDIDFSKNGDLLITSSNDATIKAWERKGDHFKLLQDIIPGKYYIYSAAISPDNKYLVFSGGDYQLNIWERKANKFSPYKIINEHIYARDLEFSPSGSHISFTKSSGAVKIFKVGNGEFTEEKSIYRHTANVFDASFHPNGKYFATASSDQSAIVWSLEGVAPSNLFKIQDYLGSRLTSAQKAVLNETQQKKLLESIPATLTAPKDEFETNIEFAKRKGKLQDATLLLLQNAIVKHFELNPLKSKNSDVILVGKPELLKSYKIATGTYPFTLLNTDAFIKIDRTEAKNLKQNWDKASFRLTKNKGKNGTYYYSKFKLKHPISNKLYDINLSENPFQRLKSKIASNTASTINRNTGNSTAQNTNSDNIDTTLGKQYALLFALDDYDDWLPLTNPINDAKTVKKELKDNYNFETELILNPNLNDILNKLRDYAKISYQPNDQLFIFFAGHGQFDDVFNEGYVVAKDSKAEDVAKTSYLSHSNLRTVINNIPSKHILLVMDVCFGGTFDPLIASSRGQDEYSEITKSEFLKRKLKYKTRLYLTSGGKEYVPDGRPGQHSPFTRKLLEALRNYGGKDGILTITEILSYIEKVNPQPRSGEFGSNDPGSDFLFIAK